MRQLLYRPSWQALRVSLLSDNRTDGGWTTVEGTKSNLVAIERYVVPIEEAERFALRHERQAMGWSSDQEFSVRLYRVINCLNAVRMGNSGQQQAGSEHDQLVLKARDGYQQVQTVEYHRHLTECAIKWDWRIIDREIRSMQYSDFERVYDNLQKRVAYATKKKGSLRTRTELEQFVELMRKVREAA